MSVGETIEHECLRDTIAREAMRLFAEQGFAATSIRQVAEAAGCTKAALYYHFVSKDQLYRQVIARELETLGEMIRGTSETVGPIRVRLTRTLHAFIDHIRNNPYGMALLHRAEFQPEDGAPAVDVAGARELHLRMVEDIVASGKASREIRDDVSARDCAIALAGTISFQFQLWICCGQPWPAGQLERTLDLLFEGIAKR